MKNFILLFITGMSFGCLIFGANMLGTEGVSAASVGMLAFGIIWNILFMIANCRSNKKTAK